MGTCVIFCAAEFDALARPLKEGDYLLAADGGLAHLQKLGLKPDGIIGDFDSLGYFPEGAEVFPVEKDDTDAMLAARKGLELGFRDFLFYGSLDGPRLDHTVANFQTLQYLADRGAAAYLIGEAVSNVTKAWIPSVFVTAVVLQKMVQQQLRMLHLQATMQNMAVLCLWKVQILL